MLDLKHEIYISTINAGERIEQNIKTILSKEKKLMIHLNEYLNHTNQIKKY